MKKIIDKKRIDRTIFIIATLVIFGIMGVGMTSFSQYFNWSPTMSAFWSGGFVSLIAGIWFGFYYKLKEKKTS